MAEELAKRDKAMADQVAEARQKERLARLAERRALVEQFSANEDKAKKYALEFDKFDILDNEILRKKLDLDSREQHSEGLKATLLAQPEPSKTELAAKLQQAYDSGRRLILDEDQSKFKRMQHECNLLRHGLVSDREHQAMLLEKVKRFSENPNQWHVVTKDFDAIIERKALDQQSATTPPPAVSPADERWANVVENQARAARYDATMQMARAASGLFFIDREILSKDHMTDFFEGDTRKETHPGKMGVQVGSHLKLSILGRGRSSNTKSLQWYPQFATNTFSKRIHEKQTK